MQNEKQLMQQAEAKMHETFDRLEAMYGKKVGRPANITWFAKGRTAGTARAGMKIFRLGRRGPKRFLLGPESGIRIRIHLGLLVQNSQEMIDKTIPHEVCHVYADRFYETDCNHGPMWSNMMVRLGLSPERCHNMDTSDFSKKRERPYIYKCGCIEHPLTSMRHKKILQGTKYRCRKCSKPLVFSHIQGRTPAPKLVEVLLPQAAFAPAANPTADVTGESKADKARRIMRQQIALGTNEFDIIGLIASSCTLSRGIAKSYYKNNLSKV